MLSSHLPAGQVQHLSVCSILHLLIHALAPSVRQEGFDLGLPGRSQNQGTENGGSRLRLGG